MKLSLRFKLAWRILFHRGGHVSDHYDGHVDYLIGFRGESRRTLVISTRTPAKIRKSDERRIVREQRIREGADQLGGILGGKINV